MGLVLLVYRLPSGCDDMLTSDKPTAILVLRCLLQVTLLTWLLECQLHNHRTAVKG